ncbi:MAG: hypothetical protein AB7P21_05365 [Lautropia sp.]
MFERRVDQADGLRRLFGRRERALLPVGAMVGESVARRAVDHLVERLRVEQHAAVAVERFGDATVGDLFSAIDGQRDNERIDRIVVVAPAALVAQVFGADLDAMLLMLSSEPRRLDAQYAALKSLVERRSIRRFGIAFVDGDERRIVRAHKCLQALAGRFLGVDLDPVRGWRFPPRMERSGFELPMAWVERAGRAPAVKAAQRYDAIARAVDCATEP